MFSESITLGTPGGVQVRIPADQVLDMLIKHIQGPGSASLAVPRIGDYWHGQGGHYAGIARADDGRQYHLIKGVGEFEGLEYGGYEKAESGIGNLWDGAANTNTLVASGIDHPAAQAAAQYEADGHSDFYLMSQREACLCAANIPHLFKKTRYWTSTQLSSDYAWAVDFEYGDVSSWNKDDEFRVCPVRRLFI
ncbi:MAG: DUF1566 domain-containing protein [Candidimonas sp.]|nr:MAG: DUF1566 domain-containing protein [Candidimonas sp.]TAM23731.1 MAG: DUF1566 domain-containing protein [Candidimonas sp.]